MSLDQITGKNIIIKQKALVHELHQTIKHLYLNKVFPHLHSCLVEVLWASMHRFESFNYIEVVPMGNIKGQTNLLLTSEAAHEKLKKTLEFL